MIASKNNRDRLENFAGISVQKERCEKRLRNGVCGEERQKIEGKIKYYTYLLNVLASRIQQADFEAS